MAKRTFKAGATSQTVDVFVQDSSSTTGAGLAGLAFNTSGLKCYYRKGATGSATAVTLATQTVGGAWSSGGFVEVDATNMKGVYRFDVPDTVLAGAGWAVLYFYGAANMAPVVAEVEIVSYDPFDATRLGISALPNAAAGASGGLPLSADSSGRVDVLKINGTSQTARDVGASVLLAANQHVIVDSGTVTTLTNLPAVPNNWLTAAGIAAAALNGKGDWLLASGYTAPNNAGISTISTRVLLALPNAAPDAAGGLITGLFGGTAQDWREDYIAFDAGASSVDQFYQSTLVRLTGGTGAGQVRLCTIYDGTLRRAFVNPDWTVTPDGTTTFVVLPFGPADIEAVTGDEGNGADGLFAVCSNYVGGTWTAKVAGVTGDVVGKVLGGGTGTIVGTGAWAADSSGAAIAPAATALSTATWTGTIAGRIDVAVGTRAPEAGGNVAAIKAKTDNLPASPAAVGSQMTVDPAQVVPLANVTAHTTVTVGDALLAARAQGAGAWSIVGATLTLKNPDGTTFRTFTLDDATTPTART